MNSHKDEIKSGNRFAFGANWIRFQRLLSPEKIAAAEASLCEMLRVQDLTGTHFLDVGCGSGLFSLAARRLGATVFSFDYDPDSVLCCKMLRDEYLPNDPQWIIQQGSVLDGDFLKTLPRFDVVYSWGVLHHSGDLWRGLSNVCALVSSSGKLFIAIYNDEDLCSRYWLMVKRCYVRRRWMRWPLIGVHAIYPFLPSQIYRALTGRLNKERGMSAWYDLIDWVGGYPFEVASVRDLFEFYHSRGFRLDNIRTTNRSGCNEMVFLKEGPRLD